MNLQKNIRRILKEEINKKFPKPSASLDKVVYKWLDHYFKDSEIYKNEEWKFYSFRFEFCKDGREIADLHVTFDDRSPDFGPSDKRATSERSVDEVILFIYPVMIDQLLSDITIRKNYLMYLIEEWFEDTYLDKIQQMFNRNDLSLDYVESSSRKRGEMCVPPISKPEGITTQEMMDYIRKTTLFSYKDMEEYEEDEPGWIENLYLAKLRGEERVNKEDDDDDDDGY